MAHFAEIDENKKVIRVIKAEQDFIDAGYVGHPANWIQTSYNTRGGVHYGPDGKPDSGKALRKNYAAPGYIYDEKRDAFYAPQPYASWTLNEDTCLWQPPIPEPTPNDKYAYQWDETNQQWLQKPRGAAVIPENITPVPK